MKSKMPAMPPGCDPEAPENSRRNFLKQSALITAVALTPAAAAKAAELHVDEKIAEAFEKLPEAELIVKAIEKRLRLKGRPETREDLKKFYDHLLRQGFGYGLIREKMSEIGKEQLDDADPTE